MRRPARESAERYEVFMARSGLQQNEKTSRSGKTEKPTSLPSAVTQKLNEHTPSPLPHHGKVFFFGVILPILAVIFETNFHYCAKHFFDPFPSPSHVVLFLLIPLSNYLTLLASRRNMSAHYSFMTLASGMAMGMGAMYSLMFLPLLGSSLLFVGAFGFGLLGLAPALSIPCTWIASKKVCHLSEARKTYFNPHQLEHIGHLIILVMVLAVELPSTLTRVNLGRAADPATSADGISWLRKYGNEEVMLRACYERSGRATDIVGSIYEAGHPLAVNDARSIFYKVTGKPFNSVPIPASARATIQHAIANDPGNLNANVEDEFDLDTDIAGETVSGVARGLSVAESSYTGKIDADARLAEIDWSFAFSNVSSYDREARAKILLPPGAFLNKATLVLNGREHDATIMVREAARQIYHQAVMEHKEDPLLVSTCGADQVLVQCYPVHPECDMRIKLSIVSPMSPDAKGNAAIQLPCFEEKNFSVDSPSILSFKSNRALTLTSSSQDTPGKKIGERDNYLLNTNVDPRQTERFEAVIHAEGVKEPAKRVFIDKVMDPPQIVERLINEPHYAMPQKLWVVIDGSIAMKDAMHEIAKGLAAPPKAMPVEIVAVRDGNVAICANGSTDSSVFQSAIKSIDEFVAAGGQDNSPALIQALKAAKNKNGSVLWIHAAQPISTPGIKYQLNDLLRDNKIPLLYDLQVAAGPVEILDSTNNSTGFKRLQRTGSVSQDLRQLFNAWESTQPTLQSNFSVREDVSEMNLQEYPALGQMFAYEKILGYLKHPSATSEYVANRLARAYHLISPISSAVVTDNDVPLKPLPKPTPNFLQEFFRPKTIDDGFASMSDGMNNITDWVNCLYFSDKIQESFAEITSHLNKLNSVTNSVPVEYQMDQLNASHTAEVLQGAASGNVVGRTAPKDVMPIETQTLSSRAMNLSTDNERAPEANITANSTMANPYASDFPTSGVHGKVLPGRAGAGGGGSPEAATNEMIMAEREDKGSAFSEFSGGKAKPNISTGEGYGSIGGDVAQLPSPRAPESSQMAPPSFQLKNLEMDEVRARSKEEVAEKKPMAEGEGLRMATGAQVAAGSQDASWSTASAGDDFRIQGVNTAGTVRLNRPMDRWVGVIDFAVGVILLLYLFFVRRFKKTAR